MKVLYCFIIWLVFYMKYCKGVEKDLQNNRRSENENSSPKVKPLDEITSSQNVTPLNHPLQEAHHSRVKRCGDYCPVVKVQPLKIKKAKLRPVMLKKLKAKPVKVKQLKVVPVEVELAEVKEVQLRPVKLKPVKVKPATVKKAKVKKLPPKTVYKLKEW